MCGMTTARLWGPAEIIAVDINQERLDFAVKNGIADVGINPQKVSSVGDAIRERTGGRGADVTIEANGFKPTFDMAVDSVRPGGTISLIGVFEKPQELAMNTLWIKNIRISMGLVNANRIPELIKLIQTGKINTNYLITHRAPLNDILKGYDVFGGKKDGCLKWVVTPYQK